MNNHIGSKQFIKATIYTSTSGAEVLSALLPTFGIDSFSVEDPKDVEFIIATKDELVWDQAELPPENDKENSEVILSFWLNYSENSDIDSDESVDMKLQAVREMLLSLKSDEQYGLYGPDADFGRLGMNTEIVCDDWKDKCKERFQTFSPCEGIVIVPPWESGQMDRHEGLRIIIDPGMAFGTGSHETTAMCLAAVKRNIKNGDIVLDAGAGSCILSIAAAKLGAEKVFAVEADADAVASAAGNLLLNDVKDRVILIEENLKETGLFSDDLRFDLITANLTCSLVEDLAQTFRHFLAPNGKLIVSGLLDVQEKRVTDALSKAGLQLLCMHKDGEWLLMEICK